MEKKVYIAAIKQRDVEHRCFCMVPYPREKCVIGVYASLAYARKKAALYGGYVVCVYPNGTRKIYMN